MNFTEFLRGVREGSPILYWTTVAHLAVIPLMLIGLAVDHRVVLGINPWIKPLKFILSVSIFMVTVAWLLKDLGHAKPAAAVGGVVAVSMIIENVLISMQSLRGVRSHFNNDTLFNGIVFNAMGFFILLNTAALVYLFLVYFAPAKPLTAGYLWGIRLGLLLTILGSLEAGLMLRMQAHTVGGADGNAGIPFLNWSKRFGDLRIAHLIGLHALQVLPIAGWLIDRSSVQHPVIVVSLVAVAYGLFFTVVLLQALSGKPLFF